MIGDANATLIEPNLPSPVYRIGMAVFGDVKSFSFVDVAGKLLLRPGGHKSHKEIKGQDIEASLRPSLKCSRQSRLRLRLIL